MFKKNLWIAGLIAVLAIMFIGCVDEYVPPAPEGEIVTVLDMQEVLKDAPLGVLTNATFSEVFDGTPFKPAGAVGSGVGIEIINAGGGKKGLKVSPTETWGSGIDVRDIATADGNTGVDYQIGDEIYIKGNAGASFQLTHGGGAYAFFDWHPAGGDFEETFTMTKKEVDDAKLAVPPNRPATIRINNDTSNRNAVFTITELVIKGYRKTGSGSEPPPPPPPPPDYSIPGSGYAPPAGTLPVNEFYLELGKAQFSKLNGDDNPTATISATKLSVTFNKNPQTIYIPFSDALKNLIKSAGDAGYKITVTIDATIGGLGGYRWAITNGETSGWATSNIISTNLTGDLTTLIGNQNSDPNGFLFQCNNNTFGTGVDITSIKFAFVGGSNPPTAITTAQKDIKITFPLAGWAPSSTIASDGVSGSVKFMPAPALFGGKFAKSTQYYAIITVTPKLGVFVPVDTTFVIKNTLNASDTVAQASYDPLTGIIITAKFTATGATDVPSPEDGAFDADHPAFSLTGTKKFSLEDYLTTNSTLTDGVLAGDLPAPLVKSGGDVAVFTLNHGGINITNRTDNYRGLDINLKAATTAGGLGLDTENKDYKITVYGNMLAYPSSGTGQLYFALPDNPWTQMGWTGQQTESYKKFEMTYTIDHTIKVPASATDPGWPQDKIRIQGDPNVSFRISMIVIEELP